jgi:hypothetical protein
VLKYLEADFGKETIALA